VARDRFGRSDEVDPAVWWFAPPVEFFVTAAFLVDGVRSGVLAVRLAAVPAAGVVGAVEAGARLPALACFVAVVFFVVALLPEVLAVALVPVAWAAPVFLLVAFWVVFAVLVFPVLVFAVLVFFAAVAVPVVAGFLAAARALPVFAPPDFFAGVAFGAALLDRAVPVFFGASSAREDRLVVEDGVEALLRASGRSAGRAGGVASVAFLTAALRADMCPP
jgi:hypothetical protein